MNYTIPPQYKATDLAKYKMTQDDIINLQIANDANISRARKAMRLGEPTIPTPEQVASPDELLADDANQEAQARTNLMKLGFRDSEAITIINSIRTDPELNFSQLNTNFPAIEKDIKDRFNIRLLTPSFFIDYFKKYSETLDGVAGVRVFNPRGNGANRAIDTVAELRRILPSPDVIEFIRIQVQNSRIFGEEIIEQLAFLREILPTSEDLQALSNLTPVRQQRIIDDLLKQFANMPSEEDIRQIANLIRDDRMDRQTLIDEIRSIVNAIPRGQQRNIVEEEIGSTPQAELTKAPDRPTTIPTDDDDVKEVMDLLDGMKLIEIKKEVKKFPNIENSLRRNDTGELISVDNLTKSPLTTAAIAKGKVRIKDTNLPDLMIRYTLKSGSGASRHPHNLIFHKPPTQGRGQSPPLTPDNKRNCVGSGNCVGRGILTRKINSASKVGPKVGRGLAVKETPSYKQYGKYAIHIPQLEQQDILNVKYKSLGGIPKFKPIPVSDIFRDFILDLLETGKTNVRVYNQIPQEERKFFEEMSIGAGVWNSLGLKRTTINTDEEENKRFELLKGEYMAGNNNPKVITDLRRLVVKMIGDGRIRKSQGIELLMELSI